MIRKSLYTLTLFALSLILLLSSCTPGVYNTDLSTKDKVESNRDKVKVVILSGQSNADGVSRIEYLSEEERERYATGPENVFIRMRNELTGRITDDFSPVTLGMGNTEGIHFGPEVGMAKALSEAFPDEEVYIIKSTYSGGGLTNGVYHPGVGEAFLGLKDWISSSLDKLRAEGKDPEIIAFCWMQGETDAIFVSKKEAKQYFKVESSFLNKLRSSFSDDSLRGGFFFVDAAINSSGVWPNYRIINDAKYSLSLKSGRNIFIDTNAYGISADTEPLGSPDRAHYDATSMLNLGHLFGEAIASRFYR